MHLTSERDPLRTISFQSDRQIREQRGSGKGKRSQQDGEARKWITLNFPEIVKNEDEIENEALSDTTNGHPLT